MSTNPEDRASPEGKRVGPEEKKEADSADARGEDAGTAGLPSGFDWRAFTPEDSPRTPMDVLADPVHVALATAEVTAGGRAFGFSGPVYDFSDGRKVITGRRFDLLEAAREQPVALVFGSYT